jgi:uroporphyrinogen decarboxylase
VTSLQRVLAAVHFQHADRPAVIPQIFAHAARLCGEDVVSYSRDGKLAARCQLAALERYDHDAVFAVLGTCADPAAFGCSARSMREGYPAIQPAPEKTRQILRDGRMPDPARCEGTREVLEAVRILRRELGDDRAVVSAVLGPMTLLSQLLGLEEAMFLAVDEPAEFVELLAAATRFASDFARCQADAGAHAIAVFDPAASPAVLPPSMIRQYLLPGLVEVIDAIHRAGPLAWQHTAGPTAPVLEDFAALGADILNFDYCVTPEEAIEKVRRV